MKMLILASLLSVSAFAQTATDEKPFEQRKQMVLQGYDMRIAALTAAKACASAATTGDALKQCHKDLKAKRAENKNMMESEKTQFRSQRAARKASKQQQKSN